MKKLWCRAASVAPLVVTLFSACTPSPAKPDPRDPFERVNRATFAFNEQFDRSFAKPVARAYRQVTPQFAQTGVTNLVANLDVPTTFVNDALQGKLQPAGRHFARFLLNSTLGLGGLLDPASTVGLEDGNEDFGQTFGRWGAGQGAYLMVPLIGPLTVRDGLGRVLEEFTSPPHYASDNKAKWGVRGLHQLDKRARLLDAEGMLDRTFDRYAFVRNAYLRRREYLVRDGAGEDEPADADIELETTGEPAESKPDKKPLPDPQPPH
jgi:phospholipid-binding lipoprotein MlaA